MKAKIWNFNRWISETDADKLVICFDALLRNVGFHILGTCNHYFEPQGFTQLWLLGESHFAVHTFPEHSKTYIELSSCNEAMYNKFVDAVNSIVEVVKDE